MSYLITKGSNNGSKAQKDSGQKTGQKNSEKGSRHFIIGQIEQQPAEKNPVQVQNEIEQIVASTPKVDMNRPETIKNPVLRPVQYKPEVSAEMPKKVAQAVLKTPQVDLSKPETIKNPVLKPVQYKPEMSAETQKKVEQAALNTPKVNLRNPGTIKNPVLRPLVPNYGAGNIDLNDRPVVHNPDGSISTTNSYTFTNDDGTAILVPGVRKGLDRKMTAKEAWDWYSKTGEHLGKFKNEADANSYAESLHDAQDKQYVKGQLPNTPIMEQKPKKQTQAKFEQGGQSEPIPKSFGEVLDDAKQTIQHFISTDLENGLKDWMPHMGNAAGAGLSGAAAGISKASNLVEQAWNKLSPVDIIWNKIFPGTAEAEEAEGKKVTENFAKQQQEYQKKYQEGATPAQSFVGQGVEAVSAMLPQIVLSVLSGGTSAAGNAIGDVTQSIIPGLTEGAISRFGQQLLEMTPFMTQAAGQYALDAEQQGATPGQQMAYGIAGGLAEGITEMLPLGALKKALGIGDDVAKETVKKGASNLISSFGKKGFQWIVNAGEQVAQEVAIDPITGFAQKAFVNNNTPVVGPNGVIDTNQMSQDAIGALGMSLVLTALGLPVNAVSHAMARNYVKNNNPVTNEDVTKLLEALTNDLEEAQSYVTTQTGPMKLRPTVETSYKPGETVRIKLGDTQKDFTIESTQGALVTGTTETGRRLKFAKKAFNNIVLPTQQIEQTQEENQPTADVAPTASPTAETAPAPVSSEAPKAEKQYRPEWEVGYKYGEEITAKWPKYEITDQDLKTDVTKLSDKDLPIFHTHLYADGWDNPKYNREFKDKTLKPIMDAALKESNKRGAERAKLLSGQDLLNIALSSYGNVEGGRGRITKIILSDKSNQEKAEAIAEEFGDGGHSLSDSLGYSIGIEYHTSKGYEIRVDDGRRLNYSWANIVKQYTEMLQSSADKEGSKAPIAETAPKEEKKSPELAELDKELPEVKDVFSLKPGHIEERWDHSQAIIEPYQKEIDDKIAGMEKLLERAKKLPNSSKQVKSIGTDLKDLKEKRKSYNEWADYTHSRLIDRIETEARQRIEEQIPGVSDDVAGSILTSFTGYIDDSQNETFGDRSLGDILQHFIDNRNEIYADEFTHEELNPGEAKAPKSSETSKPEKPGVKWTKGEITEQDLKTDVTKLSDEDLQTFKSHIYNDGWVSRNYDRKTLRPVLDAAEEEAHKRGKERAKLLSEQDLLRSAMRHNAKIDAIILSDKSNQEKAKVIADKLGTGGGTMSDSLGYMIGFEDHSPKGLEIAVDDGRKFKYSWISFVNKYAQMLQSPANKTEDERKPDKYGRAGKAALQKWAHNEYFNVDLNDTEGPETKAFVSMFEKYYQAGLDKDDRYELNVKLTPEELDFAPFVHQEFYHAGLKDAEAKEKKEAPKEEAKAFTKENFKAGDTVAVKGLEGYSQADKTDTQEIKIIGDRDSAAWQVKFQNGNQGPMLKKDLAKYAIMLNGKTANEFFKELEQNPESDRKANDYTADIQTLKDQFDEIKLTEDADALKDLLLKADALSNKELTEQQADELYSIRTVLLRIIQRLEQEGKIKDIPTHEYFSEGDKVVLVNGKTYRIEKLRNEILEATLVNTETKETVKYPYAALLNNLHPRFRNTKIFKTSSKLTDYGYKYNDGDKLKLGKQEITITKQASILGKPYYEYKVEGKWPAYRSSEENIEEYKDAAPVGNVDEVKKGDWLLLDGGATHYRAQVIEVRGMNYTVLGPNNSKRTFSQFELENILCGKLQEKVKPVKIHPSLTEYEKKYQKTDNREELKKIADTLEGIKNNYMQMQVQGPDTRKLIFDADDLRSKVIDKIHALLKKEHEEKENAKTPEQKKQEKVDQLNEQFKKAKTADDYRGLIKAAQEFLDTLDPEADKENVDYLKFIIGLSGKKANRLDAEKEQTGSTQAERISVMKELRDKILSDTAVNNAVKNSDRQNAETEIRVAVKNYATMMLVQGVKNLPPDILNDLGKLSAGEDISQDYIKSIYKELTKKDKKETKSRDDLIWDKLIEQKLLDKESVKYFIKIDHPVDSVLQTNKEDYEKNQEWLKKFDDPQYTGDGFKLKGTREQNIKTVKRWLYETKRRYEAIKAIFDEVDNAEKVKVLKHIIESDDKILSTIMRPPFSSRDLLFTVMTNEQWLGEKEEYRKEFANVPKGELRKIFDEVVDGLYSNAVAIQKHYQDMIRPGMKMWSNRQIYNVDAIDRANNKIKLSNIKTGKKHTENFTGQFWTKKPFPYREFKAGDTFLWAKETETVTKVDGDTIWSKGLHNVGDKRQEQETKFSEYLSVYSLLNWLDEFKVYEETHPNMEKPEETDLSKEEITPDTDTMQENNGTIEAGGDSYGENPIPADENRPNIPEAPENISPENVQGTGENGGTGTGSLQETGRNEGSAEQSDIRTGNDVSGGVGSDDAGSSDTSGTGTGEQHTGNRPDHVRVTQSQPKGNDYVINSQDDSVIDNGKKTRYKANVEAIKLMKQISAEGRPATADEQKILAKYCGWGGIPEVFTTASRYNRNVDKIELVPKQGWEDEYNELKSLLTEEEYRQANETILDAHYTAINVIKGMYEGLQHFGFKGGRVLEPAVGIGNFIGSMPADMRAGVKVFTGIEIDSITGGIAKLLYPNADIRVQGFEKAKLPTGYYDVAISNVPFGKTTINDSKYPNSITRSIHNYFIAKTMDVVRPGGLIMFITSSKTLDSKDTAGIRAHIKQRADLIGAIRLPNTAFKDNAMTEVTTDIIVLKVREKNTDYTGEEFFEMKRTEMETQYGKDKVPVNEYFINHPENVLGTLFYGRDMHYNPDVYVKGDGRDLQQGIIEAMNKMPADIITPAVKKTEEAKGPKIVGNAAAGMKEGSYEVKDGKLVVNKSGQLVEVDRPASAKEIKITQKLLQIKDTARKLMDAQRENKPESVISGFRKQLNTLYDAFVKEHGYLNKADNTRLIQDDPDLGFLLSLENYTKPRRENKKTGAKAVAEAVSKGDIFTKNTVTPIKKVEHVETAKEALVVSLNELGRVSMSRMAELTGKEEKELARELAGHVYKNPVTGSYEAADEYLSGNVKAKLKEAEAYAINEPEYEANAEALKAVQPADKEAWQISLKLGSSLIDAETYMEFSKHLFGRYSQIQVNQLKSNGIWIVREKEGVKSRDSVKKSVENTKTWGLDRAGFRGIDLLEKIMNNKSIIVNDSYKDDDGHTHKVHNPEATALAQERAEKMKTAFMEWLNEHNTGATIKKIVQHYNDFYNTDVLRVFDGSHLPDVLEGMNPYAYPNFKLMPHQKDAIWRIISSGRSTLLAHEVGAGKTFEMVAAIMEMKRLGIIKKALICVPNNVYEQWGIEFRRLYPAARILLPTAEEMERRNRRIFMNKIATGLFDAVIIPESQFSMLPMSEDIVIDFYNERIRELEEAIDIERAMSGKNSPTEKNITRMIKNMRAKMDKKISRMRRDADNVDFEELGIDALFVDEAHRFKNLMFTTRLQVSGLGNPEGSDKAFDLLMKVRHLQELNNGRGIVFATATPLLNSMAEIYNWQQYLNVEQLHEKNIYSFDAWASIFAKIESIAEVKPEGSGYRVKSGISKITNVGQLAKMFREFTDFRSQEMLKLPRPDVKGGKYETITVPGTSWLKEFMKELADRAEAVRHGSVDPKDDNMLKITSDGRKAALDPRLVDPSFQKEEGETTKLDAAVTHLYAQWEKTKADRLTHLVFLEFSTPKTKTDSEVENPDEEDAGVDNVLDSVYQDLKRKLIEKGIPAEEIAFIHDAKNSDQKVRLKERFNAGEIRILIGNNEKMGVGMDLQKRTKTITHIDFPWRPKDLQQEDGRGLRQGNINKEIELYVIVTEGSFDARLWDNLQRKSKLVDDMLTSDLDATEIEDVGVQTLSAQEVVGIASGNPLMQEQIVVSQKAMKLRNLEKGFRRDKEDTKRELARKEAYVKICQEELPVANEMARNIKATTGELFEITIEGNKFTDRGEAEAYIEQLAKDNREQIKHEGFYEFPVEFAGVINRGKLVMLSKGLTNLLRDEKEKKEKKDEIIQVNQWFYADAYEYRKEGSIIGLETSLRNYRHHIESLENDIKDSEETIGKLKKELEKTFPYGDELRQLTLREQELMRILNPEQVLSVEVESEEDDDGVDSYASSETDALTGRDTTTLPRGDGSSTKSKTVDDLIDILEKETGVPIRTGKFRQKAEGIFKVQPEVIRTKIRGDIPVISHEYGHYLDKEFGFSQNQKYDRELLPLGKKTSKLGYSQSKIRREGVAEFVRLYLTDPAQALAKAPVFLAAFEKALDNKTLAFLSEFRREIGAIVNLPNNKRIWNDVSDRESRRSTERATSKIQRFYDAWITESGPFARMENIAEESGWAGANLDIQAQVYRGFEAKTLNMFFDKQRDLDGNVMGDSLSEILKPISHKAVKERKGNVLQERKDFITYLISLRARDYKSRRLVMPEPFYVYEDNVLEMEKKYPHFRDIADGLREWEDNNLQLLIDSGIKTEAEIDIIKFMNANHVPLYRIREVAEDIRAGGGSTIGQSKNVIKRATGSGATIIDPLESMIADSFIIRRAAEANMILRTIYDMAGSVEGIGNMAERVPPDLQKTSLSVREVRRQMELSASREIVNIQNRHATTQEEIAQKAKELKQAQNYLDAVQHMTEAELETVVSIYRPLFLDQNNEVSVYVNGTRKALLVEKELYRAIQGLNREQMNMFLRALNKVKQLKQFGIVTNVPFILRNMARDFGTSLIQSEAGINPYDIIRGYGSAAAKDKWFHEWVAAGGATEYLNVMKRYQAQKVEDDVLGLKLNDKIALFMEASKEVRENNNARTRSKLLNASKALCDMPIDLIRAGVDVSEAGARIAEFRKAVEKGVDKQTAASWSRQLSVDFLRHGYHAKNVNAVVAFFNANLQGIVRIGETFKRHPGRTLLRGLVYVTFLTMFLYWQNHDDEAYQKLPAWRKALFWNVGLGDGSYLMIPKPPGWGWIFGALPEFAMDKLHKDDPDAFKNILDTFGESFSIPTQVSAVSPALDIWANKKWNGSPVENSYDRENSPAYLIRDDKTSLLASMIGDIAKNMDGLSPKQIDYLVQQYTGTLGESLWRLPDLKKNFEAPKDITQYPIIKNFVTDTGFSSNAIDKLYDIGSELTKRRKEFLSTGKYGAMSHLPMDKQKQLYSSLETARSEYNRLARSFGEARDVIKEIRDNEKFSPAEKKLRTKAVYSKMNEMAQAYSNKYQNFKKINKIK